MKIFTLVQSLYWKKQELHDAAWRMERKITSLRKRGMNAPKLLPKYLDVIEQIISIESQMAVLEKAAA